MSQHYHVLSGMRGYMPDRNSVAATRRDAEAIARADARQWEEAFLYYDDEIPLDERAHGRTRMVGSASSGWYEGPGDLLYHYIEIVECREDCDLDEANW